MTNIVDVGWDETTRHGSTAGVVVEVYPMGEPGMVRLAVHNCGRVQLSQREAAYILRTAADAMDRQNTEADE